MASLGIYNLNVKDIIFVPGLGSEKTINRQRWWVMRWQKRANIHFFEPNWHSEESSEDKVARLVDLIDAIESDSIEVYGASAGGPLAIAGYGKRPQKIKRLVFISPKLVGSSTIGSAYRNSAPALFEIVQMSEEVVSNHPEAPNRNVIAYRPAFDPVVPVHDMCIAGGDNRFIPTFGHATSVVAALVFVFPRYVRKN